jgi:hypothetical protein
MVECYIQAPKSSYAFYGHTQSTTKMIIHKKISRYKPIVEGSEHGLALEFGYFVWQH